MKPEENQDKDKKKEKSIPAIGKEDLVVCLKPDSTNVALEHFLAIAKTVDQSGLIVANTVI